MNTKYDDFEYSDYISNILSNIKLTKKDISYIEDIKLKIGSKSYTPILEDLYKLSKKYKLKTVELSEVYDTGVRNIQLWLKETGLNRTIKESTKIENKLKDLPYEEKQDIKFKARDTTYKNFKYEESFGKTLSEITLNREDIEFIENAIKIHSRRKYVYIIEDLYKLVKILKVTNKELSYIYDVNIRTFCNWLRELEICRYENKPKRKFKLPKKDDYINFQYETKELDILKNTTFTSEQEQVLKKIYDTWGNSKYTPIVEDLYKFWINNYSPEEIGAIYGKSNRLFQTFFKEVGLSRNKFEAQAIASTKRNYKEIMLKGRQTMIENNTNIDGSSQEQYTRNVLNCKLPLAFPNYEVIVGLNNKSILDDGKEIDIPIIIINEDEILKIAIEYNGTFWHEDKERDGKKESEANEKGYKIFYLECKENATDKQVKEEVDRYCEEEIVKYIYSYFNNNKKIKF